MRRSVGLGLAMSLALALAACSSGGASPTPPAPVVETPPFSDVGVIIVDFDFQPRDLSVKQGAKITWTNTGEQDHTVRWDDGSLPESDRLKIGGAPYERTFDAAGTFTYVCGIHGTMKGAVTVTE